MLFIFDNQCSPRMAKGMNYLEEGNTLSPRLSTIKHISELIPGNSDDDIVIKEAGKRNAFLITYDRDFKEFKQKWPLYEEHKIGVFWFESTSKVLRYWDIVKSFISQWEKIKQLADETEKPFFYQVTKIGISSRQP